MQTRRRWLHIGSWPITLRLVVALLGTALLPMLLTAYYNLEGSLRSVESTELRNLQQLAGNVGGRIDQLIGDTRHVIAYLSAEDEVISLISRRELLGAIKGKQPQTRSVVEGKLQSLLASNSNYELIMILDSQGVVQASSAAQFRGRSYQFREYFREAVQGRPYVSNIVVGDVTRRPGLFFSNPVRDRQGVAAGVAVIKLKGEAIWNILEHARSGKDRYAILVDGDGVLIYHPNPDLLYHSLVPVAPKALAAILEEKRFMLERIDSINIEPLGNAMIGAREPGYVTYRSPLTQTNEIAGYSPAKGGAWTVGVVEPQELFAAPLNRLFVNVAYSVLLVGLVFIVFALWFARGFVRPLQALTKAADAVRHGDYAHARAPIYGDDEIGQLARTFNTMVDSVHARERERDMFGRIVSPEVREKLLAGALTLGGETRRVAVLFTDIRDFSTLCERMSPQEIVNLLNEYLTEMNAAIKEWGGYLNNFIGDAIIVVFGAPGDQSDIERRAVMAALDMRDRLERLNERRRAMGDPPFQTGIGISTGRAVAGKVGSPERFLYTVIGDAVNVAARLEAMTKEFPAHPILMNGTTYEAVSQCREIDTTSLGKRAVKGRAEEVQVYAAARSDAYAEARVADQGNGLQAANS